MVCYRVDIHLHSKLYIYVNAHSLLAGIENKNSETELKSKIRIQTGWSQSPSIADKTIAAAGYSIEYIMYLNSFLFLTVDKNVLLVIKISMWHVN